MPIQMQGTWNVRVKSKSASFAQRFIITGASNGNGTYNGVTSTPAVLVTGNSWFISIQHKPSSSSSYLNSILKLKYPQIDGGEYKFDLQSNDSGGDEDFNDLILEFSTPATADDYIIYGNISYYKGCIINPCRRIIVIDTYPKLKESLINPRIREAIRHYYPALVDRISVQPQPQPSLENFRPIMVPLGGPAIPEKETIKVVSESKEIKIKADKKANKEAVSYSYNALKSISAENIIDKQANVGIAASDRNKFLKAAGIFDRFRLFCETGPIPYALLKIEEYDRSSSELSGGAYTGDGNRESLGTLNADSFGNYIFRFQRTYSQALDESIVDTAPGENAFIQARPDIIIKLLDPMSTTTSLFETAPYWNIPYLKRINLCIPKEKSGLIPTACSGQHILQGVGDIALDNEVGGVRNGFGNVLNNLGIISATADIAPNVECAAWYGQLLLRGCLKNADIKYYTLEYRKSSSFLWQPFTKQLKLPYLTTGLNAVVNRTFTDSSSNTIQGYLNVETDSGLWLEGYKNIKAKINTNDGDFENGLYYFRIQGYKDDGSKISGTSETIRLYFQHTLNIERDIDPNVTLAGTTLGNCGLFTLPVDGTGNVIEDAPVTIRFKVEHNPGELNGFINNYELSMGKGATGNFPLDVPVVDANFVTVNNLDTVVNRGRNYVHGNALNCNIRFRGTVNEVSADASGYYTVTVRPATGGWLESDQNFCAFKIHLGGNLRLTDGSSGYRNFHAVDVLIGIERPEA